MYVSVCVCVSGVMECLPGSKCVIVTAVVEGFSFIVSQSFFPPLPPLFLLSFLPVFASSMCRLVNTAPPVSEELAECRLPLLWDLNYGGKNRAVRARRQLVLG